MATVTIDYSGPRDEIIARLRGDTHHIAVARSMTDDEIDGHIAARDASIAARQEAVDEIRRKRPNTAIDESKLPAIVALPPFVDVERDILDDLAEVVEFAITRVEKMGELIAGCTIRIASNDQTVPSVRGERVLGGWTATVSYAIYPEHG